MDRRRAQWRGCCRRIDDARLTDRIINGSRQDDVAGAGVLYVDQRRADIVLDRESQRDERSDQAHARLIPQIPVDCLDVATCNSDWNCW